MSYTLRINPVAPYDGPGMERWLERLAAQGLFPGRIGDGFCWLRKGEPKARRYRLAPMGSRKDPDLEVRKALDVYKRQAQNLRMGPGDVITGKGKHGSRLQHFFWVTA